MRGQMDLGLAYRACREGGFFVDLHAEERLIAGVPLLDLIQTVLGRGSSIKLLAKGYSMAPFIKDGDVLTLSPLTANAPRFGDVVAFKLPQGNKLAIHRVIKRSQNCCLVKGDSCSEPDGLVPSNDILGLVSRIDKAGSKISVGIGPEKALIAFLSAKNLLGLLRDLLRRSKGDSRSINGFQTL